MEIDRTKSYIKDNTKQSITFEGIYNDDTGDRCIYVYLVKPCIRYYEQPSSFSIDDIVEDYILDKTDKLDTTGKLIPNEELDEIDVVYDKQWIMATFHRCKRKKTNKGWKRFYSQRIIDWHTQSTRIGNINPLQSWTQT